MPETPYIFVYGTLMSRARDALGAPMRARLAASGTSLGAATVCGRLYDLGAYPGLVDGSAGGDVVHGEVLQLADPAATFEWLDRYESIVPGDSAASEYERVIRSVRMADGRAIDCWLYLYRKSIEGAVPRLGGAWLES